MATEAVGTELRERIGARRRWHPFAGPPVRLSWGAIFGGAVAALAVWGLLYALGLALGLSAVEPTNPGSLRSSGIFTGIWSLITPILALFVGGAVASRGAGVMTRAGGALHGLVTWGLVSLAGAWLLTSVLGSVLSGVGMAALAGGAALQGGTAPSGLTTPGRAYDPGATTGMLATANRRLAAEGKPPVTPDQVEAAVTFVVQEALLEGRMNKDAVVVAITRHTDLTRAEAEDVASRLVVRFDDARQSAQTAALRAADATGKAFWGVFGVMFLSLLSALAGATIGATKRQLLTPGLVAVAAAVPPPFPREPSEAHT